MSYSEMGDRELRHLSPAEKTARYIAALAEGKVPGQDSVQEYGYLDPENTYANSPSDNGTSVSRRTYNVCKPNGERRSVVLGVSDGVVQISWINIDSSNVRLVCVSGADEPKAVLMMGGRVTIYPDKAAVPASAHATLGSEVKGPGNWYADALYFTIDEETAGRSDVPPHVSARYDALRSEAKEQWRQGKREADQLPPDKSMTEYFDNQAALHAVEEVSAVLADITRATGMPGPIGWAA